MILFGYNISITKVQPTVKVTHKHATGFTSKRWTTEEDAKLLKMYTDKKTRVGMAHMMSRTTAAINSRLWKLLKDD